jgi:hypothetical protein
LPTGTTNRGPAASGGRRVPAPEPAPAGPGLVAQTYQLVPTAELSLHPANPRRGDIDLISSSISANGFYGAVVAQRGTGHILAGNHRWMAAQRDGLPDVPVIWVDVDDDRALRILLTDNRTGDLAGYDNPALLDLLDALAISPDALAGTGYDDAALDDLRADVGDLLVLPPTQTGATYAETPEQEDERVAAVGQQPTIHQSGMRELILVYRAEDHTEAARLLTQLRADRALTPGQVVLAALRLAAGADPSAYTACLPT